MKPKTRARQQSDPSAVAAVAVGRLRRRPPRVASRATGGRGGTALRRGHDHTIGASS